MMCPRKRVNSSVCDALGCAPGEVAFVGDSKRCDVDGPRAFGMQARHLDRRAGQSLLDALAGVV
jgi:FMN phosphatase YigB (HAD superfamily)